MSWTTVIWSMSAAVCLTLAAMHGLVWLRARDAWANLLFTIAAVAAAVLAVLELNLIHAPTPAVYGEVLRWMHVSVAVLAVALVWFIHIYLQAGRRWLAWSYTGLRALVLPFNFLFYPNATFAEISSLQHVEFLGEMFSIPVGEMNPGRVLILLSNLVLLLFVLDSTLGAWKLGYRRRALTIGGATFVTLVLGATFSELMTRGILPGVFITQVFLLIVLAMAFELSVDLVRARQLAQDLEISQRRMSLAAKAANLGLWEWDMIHDSVWVTEVGRQRLGIADTRRMSLNDYLQLLHPEDRETTRQAISHVAESGGDFQAEFRVIRPDTVIRWIAARGQIERDSNGKPLRLRGVSMDITERKQAETELQQHRRDLAHASRVSTLGQLSSALAHEINQPLGAILRNTEAAELFLKQTPPDLDELLAIIMDIRKDEQRAASVIERMRALLKRRELRFETLAIDELITQVASLLDAEIQSRHVTLQIDVPGELPKIVGDRVHLQQVILNLVLNSLDAMDGINAGQRQIVIRASQTMDEVVELTVIDRGTGFAAEQLQHLFEPFYTTKSEGTGIGLAISKTIVEMHGGEISAENNPDGGSTVRFTVKVAEEVDV